MKKIIPIAVLLVFAGCTPTVTPEIVPEEQEEIEVIEIQEVTQADLNVSTKTIEEETDSYILSVEYPETAGAVKLNERIKEQVQETIDYFKNDVEETLPYLEDMEDMGKSSLYIDYEIHTLTPKLASIQFGNSQYSAGAAHPNFYTSVFNYDIERDQEIELKNLFNEDSEYLEVLSDYVIAALEQQMMDEFEYTDPEWIAQGAGPKEVNYSTFAINIDGLWFTFDPYIVGPYAIGPQYIGVPYEEIEDILSDYANELF